MHSTLDDLMTDGEVASTHRGRPAARPWLPLALVSGLVLAMAVGGWFVTRPGGGPLVAPLADAAAGVQADAGGAAAALSASRREPETVRVPAGLVGLPRHAVVSRLEARDLVALTVPVTNPGNRRPGTVTRVSPTGEVDPGSTVRVEYVAPVAEPAPPRPERTRDRTPDATPEPDRTAAEPDDRPAQDADGPAGDRPEDQPSTAPEPSDPPAAPEPEPEPAPSCKDKGNGNGNGNGKGNGKGKGNC